MARRVSYQPDGLRVSKARMQANLTQEELSERCDVHRVTIANIENNRARVSLDLLETLCRVLNRSREHLLGEAETVDEIVLAREQFAEAMHKMEQGFAELGDLVATLTDRVREKADEQREVVKL